MVEYKCERCHYVAKHKGCFKNHLQRKYPCRAIHSDVSVEELLEKLNKTKEGFACNKCNKIFKTSQGKYQHQKRCKKELVVFEEKKNDIEEIQELEPFTSNIGGAGVTSGEKQLTSGSGVAIY